MDIIDKFLYKYNTLYNIMKYLLYLVSLASFIKGDSECAIVSSFGDRRKDKTSLRLVQYNVEWLFIDYCSSSNCPGNGCSWNTVSDAHNHLSYVADTINFLEPDIINLC